MSKKDGESFDWREKREDEDLGWVGESWPRSTKWLLTTGGKVTRAILDLCPSCKQVPQRAGTILTGALTTIRMDRSPPALSWVQCGREKNVTGGDADYGENPGDWENHSNHNIFQQWGWKPRQGGWLLASICDIDRCNMEIIHNIQSFEPKTATFIRFKLWHCHLKFLWRAQQWWSWWCSRGEKYSAVWGQERH